MMTVGKEEEEYKWREVPLPSLIPKVPEPELERETGERRRGRDVLIAVDHGPNTKHAFDWPLLISADSPILFTLFMPFQV
ncbi:putative septum site-determining protein MinC [Bienertia sinuspersici]